MVATVLCAVFKEVDSNVESATTGDARTQNHRGGAKRRKTYTFEAKAEILAFAEEVERRGGFMTDLAKEEEIDEGMLSRWRRD